MDIENIVLKVDDLNTDNVISLNLEQDFDELKVLSLAVSSDDVYNRVSSNEGVIAGSIKLKNGVGVQNAKVSVFIPITTDDLLRNDIIKYYPFTSPTDAFPNGLRHNLLPRVRNAKNASHRAVGSFPDVNDFVNYPILEEVYNKYYKFTATTNENGDYMIFGVPVGPHQVRMDFDLFDTNSFNINASDLANQLSGGETINSIKSFISANISGSTLDDVSNIPGFIYTGNGDYEVEVNVDIDKMPNIFTEVKQLNVLPFWGDNNNVGITECNFTIDYTFIPTATFFGFIGSSPEYIGYNFDGSYFTINNDSGLDENSVIEANSVYGETKDGRIAGGFYPVQELEVVIYKMDDTNTVGTRKRIGTYRFPKSSGVFKINLPMYSDYYMTNEYGDKIPTENKTLGVPTKGSYCFEFYEADKINYGTRRPWGGFKHQVLSGVRIPANNEGDPNIGGWLGTYWGSFEYDILNNRRKFYTIKTSYKSHGNTINQNGLNIPYIPKIDTNKSEKVFWQHPVSNITGDTEVIGSCFLPRISVNTARGTVVRNVLRNFSIIIDDVVDVNRLKIPGLIEEIVYGIGSDIAGGSSTVGKNIGPVFEELFNSNDFTSNNLDIYGQLDTVNFGDNSGSVVYRGTPYSRDLAKSKNSEANSFNVHPPYNKALNDTVTVGLFVNCCDFRNYKTALEIEIVDITNDLPDLIANTVYSSYGKQNNMYNGKYYYFGMWDGANSLIDIENIYFK